MNIGPTTELRIFRLIASTPRTRWRVPVGLVVHGTKSRTRIDQTQVSVFKQLFNFLPLDNP